MAKPRRGGKHRAGADWRIASGPTSPPVWQTAGQAVGGLNGSFEDVNAATRGALEAARRLIVQVVRENPAQSLEDPDAYINVAVTQDGIDTQKLLRDLRKLGVNRRDMVHLSVTYVLARNTDAAGANNGGSAASFGIQGAPGLVVFLTDTP